jgi:thiamine biosynthesis lipoprotein
MRTRKTLYAVAAFCALVLLAGCTGARPRQDPRKLESKRKTTFQYFGTVCFASVYDDFTSEAAKERFESAWQDITAMLAALEAAASFDKAGSDVRRFNDARGGESIPISAMTADIIALAQKLHAFTNGAFNPAVANLVDLWGFSPRFRNDSGAAMPYDRPKNEDGSFNLPEMRYVEAFRKLSDFSLVRLGGSAGSGYYLTKEAQDITIDDVSYSLKIDLGGIAKGYGADKAAAILEAHGYEYGYVNLGLSSMKLLKRNISDEGAPAAHMWAVSISNPDDRAKNYLSVFGKNTGVSTSGTYDIHYSIGQREYSHIIDGRTGEPTRSDILSVTVLGPDAGFDDVLSTALCVMGKEEAVAFMDAKLKANQVAMIVRSKDGGLDLVTNIAKGGYVLSE